MILLYFIFLVERAIYLNKLQERYSGSMKSILKMSKSEIMLVTKNHSILFSQCVWQIYNIAQNKRASLYDQNKKKFLHIFSAKESYSSAIWEYINGLQAHLAPQVDEGTRPLQQQQQHAYAAARVGKVPLEGIQRGWESLHFLLPLGHLPPMLPLWGKFLVRNQLR